MVLILRFLSPFETVFLFRRWFYPSFYSFTHAPFLNVLFFFHLLLGLHKVDVQRTVCVSKSYVFLCTFFLVRRLVCYIARFGKLLLSVLHSRDTLEWWWDAIKRVISSDLGTLFCLFGKDEIRPSSNQKYISCCRIWTRIDTDNPSFITVVVYIAYHAPIAIRLYLTSPFFFPFFL